MPTMELAVIKTKIYGRKIFWPIASFLILQPIMTAIAVAFYFIYFGNPSTEIWVLTFLLSAMTSISITAGYHRYFSHRSYEAHPVLQWIYLVFGSGAFQGSVIKWGSDHRIHHAKVDTELDPYSIKKGFFYAHMAWLLLEDLPESKIAAPDLEKSKLLQFQHKYYPWLATLCGFGLPMFLGWILGDALGGLIFAGSLRIILTQQTTFFINSLAHMIGRRPYSKEITARDSTLIAVFTFGEGYHNYHHKFQVDYRNGIHWFHWDPTKWLIYALSAVGLTSKLKRVPATEILKAKMLAEEEKLLNNGIPLEKINYVRERILEAQKGMKNLRDEYNRLSLELKSSSVRMQDSSRKHLADLQAEVAKRRRDLELARLEFKSAIKQWRILATA